MARRAVPFAAAYLDSPDLLGYLGGPADRAAACAYQRDRWGALDGETALLEISAIRARSLGTNVDREAHREDRIKTMEERLARWQPEFVLFYDKGYREIYARIAGRPFDSHGYCRRGATLCALVPHPTARSNPAEMRSGEWWASKGREMRKLASPTGQVSGTMISKSSLAGPTRQPAPPARLAGSIVKAAATGQKLHPGQPTSSAFW